MFNKNKPFDLEPQARIPNNPLASELSIPPTPEPAPRAELGRAQPRSSSLSTLAAGVKYEGNISGAGELQVEGSLKGDIRVVQVVIGEHGSVEGAIHADVLHVRGRVNGAIVAKQVHLYATARIEGDITQEQIAIDRGASFQGRCTQAKREAPPAPQIIQTPSKTTITAAQTEPSVPEKLSAKTA